MPRQQGIATRISDVCQKSVICIAVRNVFRREWVDFCLKVMRKRPLSITVVGLLFLITGVVTFGFHLWRAWVWRGSTRGEIHSDVLLILSVSLLALVAGVFMLLGSNWARWLALAWLAFHVVISALNSWQQTVMHTLLFALIAWLLLRPEAAGWFAPHENQVS
jgi:hypothetical protein